MITHALLMLWMGAVVAQDDPRLQPAMKQYQEGGTAAAIKVFRDVCDAPGAAEDCWFEVARFLVGQRAWRDCLPFAREARTRSPDDPSTHLTLGNCYLYLNQPELAVQVFADSVERFPEQPAMHYNYGLALGRSQVLSLAEEHYLEALKLDPDNPLFLYTMGQHQLLLLKNEDAAKWLRKSASVDPPHPDARWRLATVLADMGREEEARVAFLEALETARAHSRVEALFHFGVFQYDRDRHELALKRFDLAIKNNPRHRLAHQYRARCLRALGRMDEARAAAGRYRELQRDEDQENEDFLLGLLSKQLGLDRERSGDEDDDEPPPEGGQEGGEEGGAGSGDGS